MREFDYYYVKHHKMNKLFVYPEETKFSLFDKPMQLDLLEEDSGLRVARRCATMLNSTFLRPKKL